MQSLVKKQSAKLGLPPGTLIHIGEQRVNQTQIRSMIYDQSRVEEHEFTDPMQCKRLASEPGVTWIDVDGVHDVNLIGRLGAEFGLHPLVLEDIVNTNQRPKLQDFGDYIFIVIKFLDFDEAEDEIASDQISIILGPDFVLSFSERLGDEFRAVRQQLRDASNRLRARGTEYLTYRLVDSVVDHYFQIVERIGSRLEDLEDRLLENTAGNFLPELHNIKRELLFMRTNIWPLRPLMDELKAASSLLLGSEIRHYWDDVRDHVLNVVEMIETLRDMGAGNLEVYLSTIQYRQNDVMKVLTIIATIFLPLTFLVGVWGMNFQHMPEIPWKWGYAAAWAVMIGITVGMLWWFRRKRWW
jgi:magnesium transporter